MCAIADGQAWCWGQNVSGQIGDNTTTSALKPTKVSQDSGILLGKTVTSIAQDGFPNSGSLSNPHTCAAATDSGGNSRAYCWGENDFGQLGDGSTTDRIVPVAVRATSGSALHDKQITSVASGLRHSCALTEGKVYCWGINSSGHLGRGFTNWREILPSLVYDAPDGSLYGKTVVRIDAGANRGCAVAGERTYCWGLNNSGQIGDGSNIDRNKPTEALFLRPRDNQYIY